MDKLFERNKNLNRGFRKLIVWQEAIDFYAFVDQKINLLSNISFKVKGQIDESAFSVHSNIAEGYSRRSLKDNIRFNNYALSSLAENYSQIYALLKVAKIDNAWFDQYDARHYSLENKLISYTKAQVQSLREKKNWNDDYTLHEGEIEYE